MGKREKQRKSHHDHRGVDNSPTNILPETCSQICCLIIKLWLRHGDKSGFISKPNLDAYNLFYSILKPILFYSYNLLITCDEIVAIPANITRERDRVHNQGPLSYLVMFFFFFFRGHMYYHVDS